MLHYVQQRSVRLDQKSKVVVPLNQNNELKNGKTFCDQSVAIKLYNSDTVFDNILHFSLNRIVFYSHTLLPQNFNSIQFIIAALNHEPCITYQNRSISSHAEALIKVSTETHELYLNE